MDKEPTTLNEKEHSELPFAERKIPIAQGVREFQIFREGYPNFSFCPYLAFKDEDGWGKSTSRVYMNQVFPSFLYVPVNIGKDDSGEFKAFFNDVRNNPKIVAANITQPHKSNPVLMEEFSSLENKPTNIDALIRNEEGQLVPFDLNGPSFMGWYEDEVGAMNGKLVLLVGVGGVGEPIARRLAKANPSGLVLIDPVDKTGLVNELGKSANTFYKPTMGEIVLPENEEIVVINAAGKEGAVDDSGLYELLQKAAHKKGVFVDLRPQLEIDTVKKARALGWHSFTGHGMNARNDYALLEGIAKVIGATPPPFTQFKELVARAS